MERPKALFGEVQELQYLGLPNVASGTSQSRQQEELLASGYDPSCRLLEQAAGESTYTMALHTEIPYEVTSGGLGDTMHTEHTNSNKKPTSWIRQKQEDLMNQFKRLLLPNRRTASYNAEQLVMSFNSFTVTNPMATMAGANEQDLSDLQLDMFDRAPQILNTSNVHEVAPRTAIPPTSPGHPVSIEMLKLAQNEINQESGPCPMRRPSTSPAKPQPTELGGPPLAIIVEQTTSSIGEQQANPGGEPSASLDRHPPSNPDGEQYISSGATDLQLEMTDKAPKALDTPNISPVPISPAETATTAILPTGHWQPTEPVLMLMDTNQKLQPHPERHAQPVADTVEQHTGSAGEQHLNPDGEPLTNPASQPATNPDRWTPTSPDRQPPTSPDRQPPTNPDKQPPTNPNRQPPTNTDRQPPTSPDRQPPTNPDRQPLTIPDTGLPTSPDRQPPASSTGKSRQQEKLHASAYDPSCRLLEQAAGESTDTPALHTEIPYEVTSGGLGDSVHTKHTHSKKKPASPIRQKQKDLMTQVGIPQYQDECTKAPMTATPPTSHSHLASTEILKMARMIRPCPMRQPSTSPAKPPPTELGGQPTSSSGEQHANPDGEPQINQASQPATNTASQTDRQTPTSPDRQPPTDPDRQPPTDPARQPPTDPDRQPPTDPDRQPPTSPDRQPPTSPDTGLPANPDREQSDNPDSKLPANPVGTPPVIIRKCKEQVDIENLTDDDIDICQNIDMTEADKLMESGKEASPEKPCCDTVFTSCTCLKGGFSRFLSGEDQSLKFTPLLKIAAKKGFSFFMQYISPLQTRYLFGTLAYKLATLVVLLALFITSVVRLSNRIHQSRSYGYDIGIAMVSFVTSCLEILDIIQSIYTYRHKVQAFVNRLVNWCKQQHSNDSQEGTTPSEVNASKSESKQQVADTETDSSTSKRKTYVGLMWHYFTKYSELTILIVTEVLLYTNIIITLFAFICDETFKSIGNNVDSFLESLQSWVVFVLGVYILRPVLLGFNVMVVREAIERQNIQLAEVAKGRNYHCPSWVGKIFNFQVWLVIHIIGQSIFHAFLLICIGWKIAQENCHLPPSAQSIMELSCTRPQHFSWFTFYNVLFGIAAPWLSFVAFLLANVSWSKEFYIKVYLDCLLKSAAIGSATKDEIMNLIKRKTANRVKRFLKQKLGTLEATEKSESQNEETFHEFRKPAASYIKQLSDGRQLNHRVCRQLDVFAKTQEHLAEYASQNALVKGLNAVVFGPTALFCTAYFIIFLLHIIFLGCRVDEVGQTICGQFEFSVFKGTVGANSTEYVALAFLSAGFFGIANLQSFGIGLAYTIVFILIIYTILLIVAISIVCVCLFGTSTTNNRRR